MNNAAFQGTLDICQLHADRLRWAMDTLAPLLPLTAERLNNLTGMELAVLDQFVVRFSKLQDSMGAKLLPAVLELTHEQGSLTTFIDKLHRLEKIGALDSAEHWLQFREMRNQFAHDYPADPEIQASLLNRALLLAEEMLQTLAAIESFSQPYRVDS